MERVDILVAGGGTAGLAAAAAFGALGLRVLCVDPSPPEPEALPEAVPTDLRTTAILQPGRALLERAGLWEGVEADATPLRVMRIVDAAGRSPVARDFEAGDLGDAPFGWNVPNRTLRAAFAARLRGLPGVELRRAAFRSRLAREEEVVVALSDGAQVAARLLVGADGRNSAVREACGIGMRTERFGQTALVFAVTHDEPHHGVSTEVHRRGGPFTLVPLPDVEGRPASSVVWMTDGPEARRLMALTPEAFEREANLRAAGVQGHLTLAGARQAWPIVTQVAQAMTARRTALMAEAAHVVPPIGAQGLNMSLADLAALEALARERPAEVGADPWLRDYARAREGDVRLRALGIGLLNRASQGGFGPLRALGIRAAHDLEPLRRGLMRLGLGLS